MNKHGWWLVVIIIVFAVITAGCSSKPVIQTQIVEKPVPVPCRVKTPGECSQAYALDKVSPRDEPLTINRAMRMEIEQRAACQVALLAAVKGCNQP